MENAGSFKFQNFLEAAPDAVVAIDMNGNIAIVNALTEKMFGYDRLEILGKPIEILIPERYKASHISFRNRYFENPKTRFMGEGKALLGRKKDGSEFQVEISLSPLESEQGPLISSIIRDVGQRKHFEAQFKGLLESAPDGIVVVNSQGKIIIVNSQTEAMFHYDRNELLGMPIEILLPTPSREKHVGLRDAYILNPVTRPMGAGKALTGRQKDGSEFPVEISLSPLETEQGVLIMSIIRDITERRHAEELLQTSLREKEVLLREIHHRVKNNLQVTSSLLRLQSNYVQDQESRDLFAESQNRIQSMALVHEKLYQSKELSRINFRDYASSLIVLLFKSFGVDTNRIHFTISEEDIFLGVDTAVPCGLMINEMISNSLKHAFPDAREGTVHVSLASAHQTLSIQIRDDGVGLPVSIDLDRLKSLGIQLIRTLTHQLNGKLDIQSNTPGTTFTVTFPISKGA